MRRAVTAGDVDVVRRLFEEYQAALGVDLSFQSFDEELATLPGDYAAPRGRLWLATSGGDHAGCVALRPLPSPPGADACEMKRLYVRDAHRARGIGRLLVGTAVAAARELGYREMLLDTLPTMREAAGLYRALGFEETSPYRHNPIEGTLYFRLVL